MICFRDKSYCSASEQCANKNSCSRYFSESERDAAERWWGNDGAPVAFSSFKENCDKWEPICNATA